MIKITKRFQEYVLCVVASLALTLGIWGDMNHRSENQRLRKSLENAVGINHLHEKVKSEYIEYLIRENGEDLEAIDSLIKCELPYGERGERKLEKVDKQSMNSIGRYLKNRVEKRNKYLGKIAKYAPEETKNKIHKSTTGLDNYKAELDVQRFLKDD